MIQRGQQDNGHYSSHEKRIAENRHPHRLSRISSDKQEKRMPAHNHRPWQISRQKKHELRKFQHQLRQKTVIDVLKSPALSPSYPATPPHSTWDLLRRYKTDHVQSILPAQNTWQCISWPPNMEIGASNFWPSGLASFQVCPWTPSPEAQVVAIQWGCCPENSNALCSTCTPL